MVKHVVKQSKDKSPGPDNAIIDLIEAAGKIVYNWQIY